jgi:hypothetical protein
MLPCYMRLVERGTCRAPKVLPASVLRSIASRVLHVSQADWWFGPPAPARPLVSYSGRSSLDEGTEDSCWHFSWEGGRTGLREGQHDVSLGASAGVGLGDDEESWDAEHRVVREPLKVKSCTVDPKFAS